MTNAPIASRFVEHLGSYVFMGSMPMYELPLTGGAGPLVVTAIGVSLAALSLLLFILRGKSDNKSKKKNKNKRI